MKKVLRGRHRRRGPGKKKRKRRRRGMFLKATLAVLRVVGRRRRRFRVTAAESLQSEDVSDTQRLESLRMRPAWDEGVADV